MPPGNEPAVDLRGVSHQYGAVAALRDVSLTIARGSAVAVVGPDGVGKSTLLSLIAGVKVLQQGQVRSLGYDLAGRGDRDTFLNRVAFMPQGLGHNLYPTLTVAENIDFFGRLFGWMRRARGPHAPPAGGHGPCPFPRPARGQAFGRHEAEAEPVLRAGA
jgi:ribosome-dependent ATPase